MKDSRINIALRVKGRPLENVVGVHQVDAAQHPPAFLLYEGYIYMRSQLSMAEQPSLVPDATEVGELRQFGYGDLRKELESVLTRDVVLRKGNTVPAKKVSLITRLLRKRGWDAKFEAVRAKLKNMGYYDERI